MSGFTKLFNSILHSTIWSEPNEIRILWITLLAMADKYGEVSASVPGLARMAGITLEQTQDGLARFQMPDPFSRTPDNEGRRICEISGGWKLLNHGKYRALMSAEERREYNRLKQAERRAKVSKKCQTSKQPSMTINDNQQCQHIAEADAEAIKTPIVPKHPKRSLDGFDQFWSKYPKKKSKGAAERAWQNLNGTSLEIILQAVQDQIPELLREGGRYCPYPATWLNQKKWEDELTIFQNRNQSAI